MFESNPETQNQFRKFQGMDLVQLEQSAEMAQHGKRVLSIVGMAVDNLDNYQIVWDNLIKVGREHFSKYYYYLLPIYNKIIYGIFGVQCIICLLLSDVTFIFNISYGEIMVLFFKESSTQISLNIWNIYKLYISRFGSSMYIFLLTSKKTINLLTSAKKT